MSQDQAFRKLVAGEMKAAGVEADQQARVIDSDLDACLGNELVQFADFVNAYQEEQGEDVSRENFMYHPISKKRVQSSFPNVEIALRMYLVLMISNCIFEDETDKKQTSHIDVQ